MQLLATISDRNRLALALDLSCGAVEAIPVLPQFKDAGIHGRPSCRPFGITWTSTELFIANNRQLLVFDSRLNYLRTLSTSLQVNTHQLAYHANRVWAVSPWTNSLIGVSLHSSEGDIELDLIEHTLGSYLPRIVSEEGDEQHFNSLLWAGERLYVAAHAFGDRSFIVCYDEEVLHLTDLKWGVGSSIHGLALANGELFWLSSGTGELRSSRGVSVALSRTGYARGFAMTHQYFIVAISQFLSRDERSGGDSWIQVIDRRDHRLVHELHLRDTGSINDLRLLDEYDHAHQLDPFWDTA